LRSADAFHGKAQALHQVSMEVHAGEIVSLIGRNGAGKTTTLRVLAGLMRVRAGSLVHDGVEVTHLPVHKLSRRGTNYVPETRRIFPNLSVEENLGSRRSPIAAAFGPLPGSTDCSRGSPSGAGRRATRCPAASSRRWPSRAGC